MRPGGRRRERRAGRERRSGGLPEGRVSGAAPSRRDRRRVLLRGDGARARLVRDRAVRPARRGPSALLWIVLFFAAATGLPRAFVREEETGTALALRKTVPANVVLAGKTLYNALLFVAVAAVTIPGFAILLEWRVASPLALAATVLLGGVGLAVVSTFLSAVVSAAGQRNVLFVLIAFPLLLPLLLVSIAATLEATRGGMPWTGLRVLVAYDGAAACAAYLLIEAVWEE
jgi:heme exporter protein B